MCKHSQSAKGLTEIGFSPVQILLPSVLCGGHKDEFLTKKPNPKLPQNPEAPLSLRSAGISDIIQSRLENWYLSSDKQDRNASEGDIFEEHNLVMHNNGNADAEEILGDTRSQVQNIVEKFKGDINKTLHVKRKSMETYVKDSFKDSNENLEQIWKVNKRERKKVNNKFCKQYISTFQKFDMDVQKYNEEQENSAINFQAQQKTFKLSTSSQNQSLKAIRELHESFMQGLMNLDTNNYDVLLDVDGELKKEMSAFKRSIMKHTLKYSSTFDATSD
ncbi:X-linked lymphocyte-regulated protein PM1-like [Apodemus sylvaticus]|uniref:X-linked lymphocyte-regulated protein PM1-like n=1 Tax=Apodemus sylvaticus TaxID=10129 RepID=UPI0022433519|nr:X-linked lymphocyte-regulated protein PM1-like [Apodemus sylvaticus]